jgi:hypothetical protein
VYRNNLGERPPRRRLLKRILGTLEWLHFRHQGVLFSDDLFPSRSAPHPNLPRAELTEDERKQAIEEIRRRPRIG